MVINYQKIYKKAAQKYGGWSAKSKLDITTTWGDFYEYIIKRFLSGKEVVLDIGSAEGNNFIRLTPFIKEGFGIDLEPAMIRLANKNKKRAGVKNIEFRIMNGYQLDFSKDYFDLVINKHSPICFKEAVRVLKPGGNLITQQVHEIDKINIKKTFKRGQNYKVSASTLLKSYIREAQEAGFINIKSKISNIPYFFPTKKDLLVFLCKTPVIPDFDAKKDHYVLEKFIEKNKSPRGIRSNTSRFLLTMTKPRS